MQIIRVVRSLTIALIVMQGACGYGCSSHEPANAGTTFFYNEPDGLGTLDPAQIGYRAAICAGMQLHIGLVQLDSNLQVAPAIAHSWSVDNAGLEWTFHLRTDVFFHKSPCFGNDSTRTVNAEDVRFSIERICDARTKTTGFWVFRGKLLGADEYHEATKNGTPTRGISGITVVNDSTVTLRLQTPFAPFLSMLTMPYAFIVPREALDFYGDKFFENPVGAGPFAFVNWQEDVELRLAKHPLYFERNEEGVRLPYLDHVVITFVRDTKTEFVQFREGQLDFVSSVDPSFSRSVFTSEGQLTEEFSQYTLLRTAAHSIDYYGILLDDPNTAASELEELPLAQKLKLRQALNYAVDREKIVRYVLFGKGIPAHHGVLPMSMPGFSENVRGYRYDLEMAKTLLAEAGYPNGQGLPPLTLQLGQSERTFAVAEAVQEQWKQLGITLNLRQVDFPQHLEMVRQGKLPLWRTSWIGDYPDPENFLALFCSRFIAPKGPNTTRISRRDLDSLYDAALSPTLSAEERYRLYHDMERIVIDEAPWVFLYYNVLQRLAQPWVQGMYIDGADRLSLVRVRKSKADRS